MTMSSLEANYMSAMHQSMKRSMTHVPSWKIGDAQLLEDCINSAQVAKVTYGTIIDSSVKCYN